MSAATTTTPRIYVASLSDYNAGILHGRWIDATLGLDHIQEEVQAMLKESPAVARGDTFGVPAEEWAIHDYEGFGSHRLSEWESFEKVAELAEAIEEKGEEFLAYLAICDSAEAAIENFDEARCGQYESMREYAYYIVPELGWGGISPGKYVPEGDYSGRGGVDVLEELSSYLDWDLIARELEHDHTESGGYIFRSYL